MMQFFRRQSSCALTRFAFALAVLTTLPLGQCSAGPVILATDGSVTYDASTEALSVQATGLFFLSNYLPFGNPQVPITDDGATLSLTVNSSGQIVGTGTIAMNGAIDFDQDGTNDVSGSLLTGSITAFSSAGAGPAPWDFNGLFNITGGLLTQASIPLSGGGVFTDLYQVGALAQFNLEIEQQVSGILGDFLADFSGVTVKGLVASVPEPGTLTLSLIVLMPAAIYARLRGRGGRKRV
jgi:hypothetical protein